jgi:hypothetical protein
MEIILVLIYGIAFAAIIYYMVQLKPMYSPMEKAVSADTESPRDDVAAQVAWPWSITSYSFWPAWFKGDGSPLKDDGSVTKDVKEDYRYEVGKYGYTGRQDSNKYKQVFGNGYGEKGHGGTYSGGGSSYGYTGRSSN